MCKLRDIENLGHEKNNLVYTHKWIINKLGNGYLHLEPPKAGIASRTPLFLMEATVWAGTLLKKKKNCLGYLFLFKWESTRITLPNIYPPPLKKKKK